MDGEHFTYDNVLLIAKGINAPQSTADDRNAAAVTSFQMEVEAAALVCPFCFPYFCFSWTFLLPIQGSKGPPCSSQSL